MEKIFNIAVLVMTLICLYIILTINLNWFYTFGEFENSKKINEILSNISYSIVAGYLFYLFTSFFPRYFRTKKMDIVITSKISALYQTIMGCIDILLKDEISSVEDCNNLNYLDSFNIESIKNRISGKTLFDKYWTGDDAIICGLMSRKSGVKEQINEILVLSEFLSNYQIECLEHIRNAHFWSVLNYVNGDDNMQKIIKTDLSKWNFSEVLSTLIMPTKDLVRTIKYELIPKDMSVYYYNKPPKIFYPIPTKL